jgi:colicin import membrane protein
VVTRRSPLGSLEALRQRARDSQRARLADEVKATEQADARAEAAESAVQSATAEHEQARQAESQRAREVGLRAAEGLRRAAWEAATRRQLATLQGDAEQCRQERESALVQQEQAAAQLERLDTELKQVKQRLDAGARVHQRRVERDRQDAQDDLSLHRFLNRKDA